MGKGECIWSAIFFMIFMMTIRPESGKFDLMSNSINLEWTRKMWPQLASEYLVMKEVIKPAKMT